MITSTRTDRIEPGGPKRGSAERDPTARAASFAFAAGQTGPDVSRRGDGTARGVTRSPRQSWVLRFGRAAGCAIALAALACAPAAERGAREANQMIEDGKIDEANALLETLVRENPNDPRIHVTLCSAGLAAAQKAFDACDEPTYIAQIAQAQKSCLRAIELDRNLDEAHNLMGILAAYQSDLESSRVSFERARKLSPRNPVYATNLAELYVYLGREALARQRLDLARKLRAPPAPVELVEVLDAWKRGDYVTARDTFADVAILDPETVRTWNGASSIRTFEDFTAHCCRLPLCGPYMRGACTDMKQKVVEREVSAETARAELVMQMERARQLRRERDSKTGVTIAADPVPEDEKASDEKTGEDDAPPAGGAAGTPPR